MEDLQNVLSLLVVEGYLNTSVDELIEDNCSLPHSAPVSNNCNNLTGE